MEPDTLESIEIVELVQAERLDECAAVIRAAFATVAAARGLTPETAPTHPSLTSTDEVTAWCRAGVRWFAAVGANGLVGCVALKRSSRPGVCYLERLAVLPDRRHHGLGRRLVERVARVAREQGARELSIGIIDDDDVLERWYEASGFRKAGTKRFPHLPFTVAYLTRTLEESGQAGAAADQ